MAATLALQLERPDDAIELLVGQPENDPAIRLLRGKILVLKKDGPGAVALLQAAARQPPPGHGAGGAAQPRRGRAAGRQAGGGGEADRGQGRGAPRARAAARPGPAPGRQRRRGPRHPEAAGRQAPRERQRDRAIRARRRGSPWSTARLLLDAGHAAEAVPFLERVDVTTRATPRPGRRSPGASTPPAARRRPARPWPRPPRPPSRRRSARRWPRRSDSATPGLPPPLGTRPAHAEGPSAKVSRRPSA